MTTIESTQQLRQRITSIRKNLPLNTIEGSAEGLASYIQTFHCYKQATSIGAYLAVNGEANPSKIIQMAWLDGKTVYLPVISGETLVFAPYSADSDLVSGQFNIPIPAHSSDELLNPHALDIVIVPLVAFDTKLNRIGMGGGFYDKTFSSRKDNFGKPRLLGIAHDLQRVKSIEAEPWDIPMDGVVTEKSVYCKPVLMP